MTKMQSNPILEAMDSIQKALADGVAPWAKPWSAQGGLGLPYNVTTKAEYRGINLFIGMLAGFQQGFTSNGWLTFKQKEAIEIALDAPGSIKIIKGSKGTRMVRYIDWTPGHYQQQENGSWYDMKGCAPLKPGKERLARAKAFTVFNTQQLEGLPAEYLPAPIEQWTPEARFANIEALLQATPVQVAYGGNKAYWIVGTNQIWMPVRSAFKSEGDFLATLLHELIHWTGHPLHMNREARGYSADPVAYAFEELVAEIGSAFLCAHYQVDGQLQHAGYIQSYLKLLEDDPTALVRAARVAEAAYSHLLELADNAAFVQDGDAEQQAAAT